MGEPNLTRYMELKCKINNFKLQFYVISRSLVALWLEGIFSNHQSVSIKKRIKV